MRELFQRRRGQEKVPAMNRLHNAHMIEMPSSSRGNMSSYGASLSGYPQSGVKAGLEMPPQCN